MCEKICPLKNHIKEEINSTCYALKNKSEEERLKSSSGGFFIELAKYFIKNNGVVYGVIFDENFVVKHTKANNLEELESMRGSKYVQSELGETFKNVKKDLEDNRKVLFTGTPCQVYGLKKFLQKDYENLTTCDNICHGVGSPKIFKEYIRKVQKKYNNIIQELSFRYKNNFCDHNIKTKISNKTIVKKPNDDEFYKMFCDDLMLRDSCLSCKFANLDRKADFTMGDFWGIEKVLSDFDDKKGCSIVLVNSTKSKDIFSKIKNNFEYKEVELSQSLQPQLQYPTSKKSNYDEFWNDYTKKGYKYTSRRYGKLSIKQKIKRIIRKLIKHG